MEAEFSQEGLEAVGGAGFGAVGEAGQNELVFHAVFPADQFGHGDGVSLGLKVKTPEHIGELTAYFAGVQWVPPKFGQGGSRQVEGFVLAQLCGHFGLATGYQDHGAGFFQKAKGDRIVGGRVASMKCGDHIDLGWQEFRLRRR